MNLPAEVAEANRILVSTGILDAFGHVSARHPDTSGGFLLARNLAPGMVTEADILEHRLDGEPLRPERVYLERFIHSAIYSARPDVGAIVHSHAPAVIPFGVTASPLRPIVHTAGFLALGVSRFDSSATTGGSGNMLVDSNAEGVRLAEALGSSAVVLMRGHGFVAVGDSLQQAVFRAVYTCVNAAVQIAAMQLGEPVYLSDAEAILAATANDGQIARAWSVWRAEALGTSGQVNRPTN